MMCSVTKRITALFLCVMLLLSTLPTAAFAIKGTDTNPQSTDAITSTVSNNLSKGSNIDGTSYRVTSVKNYSIAPDISESVIITNNDAGNSQTVANVMQVNPNEGRAKIVAGYGNRNPKELGWTLKTTTEQAHVYERETGLNVVGGVNASWFNINTGEPSGYLVMNGVVHHDNSSRAFLAAFDDGSVNVFREGTTLAQAEASQSEKQGKAVQIVEAVDALVAMVWDGKVVVSQSGNGGYYPRTSVGVKADGTVVLFQADGTMAPRSVGYTAEEEARMMVALGCVAAIQLDEGGSSTYLSQREGESDLTMRNTPAGGSERVVSGTILVVSTVAASGEFDHAAVTPDGEYYTPNSTVELTASAMDFSGAPAKALPADAVFTVSDAAMGTVSETTVNGSGASAVFTSSGKTGDVTIDLISGGKTVGSTILHVQEPDALSFASSEVNLNYNDIRERRRFDMTDGYLKEQAAIFNLKTIEDGFVEGSFSVLSPVHQLT
ncbi:MAG: phosphodiester glycosidase family protein [Oscillospiraceae bacterium]